MGEPFNIQMEDCAFEGRGKVLPKMIGYDKGV
jgi:hypothetical protein